jgi:hypothetical protein
MAEFSFFGSELPEDPHEHGGQPANNEHLAQDSYPDTGVYRQHDTTDAPEVQSWPPERYNFNQFAGDGEKPNYARIRTGLLDVRTRAMQAYADIVIPRINPSFPTLSLEVHKNDQRIAIGFYKSNVIVVTAHEQNKKGEESQIIRKYTILNEPPKSYGGDPALYDGPWVMKDATQWLDIVNLANAGEVPDVVTVEMIDEQYQANVYAKGLIKEEIPIGNEEAIHLSHLLEEARPIVYSFLMLDQTLHNRETSPLDADVNTSQSAAQGFTAFVDRRLSERHISVDDALALPDVYTEQQETDHIRIETGYEQGITRSLPIIREGEERPKQNHDFIYSIDDHPTTPYVQVEIDTPYTDEYEKMLKSTTDVLTAVPNTSFLDTSSAMVIRKMRYGVDPELKIFILVHEIGLRNSADQEWIYRRSRLTIEEAELVLLAHFAREPHCT